MITTVETFFHKGCGRCARFDTPDCSANHWREALVELRRICSSVGLEETLKWSNPCYTYSGVNIAILGAVRAGARLSFFRAELLKDVDGILHKPGPNSATASVVMFTTKESVLALESSLRSYLEAAKRLVDVGAKAPKVVRHVVLPDEIVEALDADPTLAEAFAALTPGRQRSYALFVSSAKKPETRVARFAKSREKIFAGKGAQEL